MGSKELLEWPSGLQRAIGVGSKELLEWAPKSYWSGLQIAIGVGSKELLEWALKERYDLAAGV